MRARWIAGALLALLMGCDREHGVPEPQRAADQALELLKGVLDNKTAQLAGFDSPDQAQSARLGTPVDVYVVELDSLKKWTPKDDANAFILKNKSVEVVYPVLVNAQLKSTVSIFKAQDGYRPATFGNAEIARTLARYGREGAPFIVHVAVIGDYFIGRKSGNDVYLILPHDLDLPNLPAEKPLRSVDVLPQLAMLANEPDADMPR